MKAEVVELLGSGLWRPVWFVALLSAGVVLLMLGAIWVLAGHRDGYFLMVLAVAFWGSAAMLLSVFSLVGPKPKAGHRR